MVQFQPVTLTAQQRKKAAKAGVSIASMAEADKYFGGPELGFLSLEYLLCSNVLLFSRFYHLFGEEKNGKSTILIDWLDRYSLAMGGSGLLVETENKMNVDLFRKMLGENFERLDQSRVTSLEGAQKSITEYLKALQSNLNKKQVVMAIIGIDSIRVPAQQTIDAIKAEGNATRNYAVEAALWRPYLGTVMDLAQDRPAILVGVNHAREEAVEGTGVKRLGVGGGTMFKYIESYRILVKTIKRVDQVKLSKSVLCLKTTTNTNGPMGRKIYPEIIYRGGDEGDKVYIDWLAADAALLTGDDILRTECAKQGVCDVRESSEKGLYNDDVSGLKKVPIKEITAAIYSDPERIGKFREIHQIGVHKTLDQLYEQGWFFDTANARSIEEEE